MNNINKILDEKMCCGCGACYSICPKSCIIFIEGEKVNYPQVDSDKCIDCGLCLKVCSGQINSKRLITGKKLELDQKIKSIKIGYSTDYNLRFESASGGIITQLVKSLLSLGIIDGAVVVTQNRKENLMNTIKIVSSFEELKQSQGSRYSPSSNCMILKELSESAQYKKVIFIGKPCDIEAITAYEENDKRLKNKIYLKIAIMCHHSPTRDGVKKILKDKKINVEEVKNVNYRGGGWPGYFSVLTNQNKEVSIPYFEAWNNYLCKDENIKCLYCENPFPLDADIIVGDPWGDEFNEDKIGQSLFIIRSDKADAIINNMENNNDIITKVTTYEDVKRYQKNLLIRYHEFYLLKLLFKKVHKYKITIKDYIHVLMENPANILRYFIRIG